MAAVTMTGAPPITSSSDVPDNRVLSSPWGERVDIGSPLPEYPRPDMVRPDWLSLNGLWDYAVRPSGPGVLADEIAPAFKAGDRDGRIVVPFAPECVLSGVGASLAPTETLWYRRSISLPAAWAGRRVMLRFEAVDYIAAVFIDGSFWCDNSCNTKERIASLTSLWEYIQARKSAEPT